MTTFFCTVKPPGSQWNASDLAYYGINCTIVDSDANRPTLFGVALPCDEGVAATLGTATGAAPRQHERLEQFIANVQKLEVLGREALVVEFIAFVLRYLDFDDRRTRMVRTGLKIPLIEGRRSTEVEGGVVVTETRGQHTYYVLVAVPCEGGAKLNDAEAKLVAMALAAYQHNFGSGAYDPLLPLNRTWMNVRIPAVIMVGTAPVFYQVTVNPMDCQAVSAGQSATSGETALVSFTPPAPDVAHYFAQGMSTGENKGLIFRYMLALKSLMVENMVTYYNL